MQHPGEALRVGAEQGDDFALGELFKGGDAPQTRGIDQRVRVQMRLQGLQFPREQVQALEFHVGRSRFRKASAKHTDLNACLRQRFGDAAAQAAGAADDYGGFDSVHVVLPYLALFW